MPPKEPKRGLKRLIIVESPAKAKTIERFLGGSYAVLASYGHVRDLPQSKLGVDVEHGFAPHYVVPPKAREAVKKLSAATRGAAAIYFATDEDREGEAIAWHLAELLKVPADKVERIVFHEITETAIREALEKPRPLDSRLVDAQQARRILDRLVGYELSPFLWRKIRRGLSAGRVQSAALRLIVEREREITAFKAQEYWTIEGKLTADGQPFGATLRQVDGQTLGKFDIGTAERANELAERARAAAFNVTSLEERTVRRSPPPPYTTATLQQEANRRLGLSVRQAMRLAQQLYEGVDLPGEGSVGLITYMRTDSVNLAEKFLDEAHEMIGHEFGAAYQLQKPRRFANKSKNAQEAHEAIRPTEAGRTPASLAGKLEPSLAKLYDLIWRRAVASQMPEAEFTATAADLSSADQQLVFRATGNVLRHDGYLKVYPQRFEAAELPKLAESSAVSLEGVDPVQHFTEPPARYSEAALVKDLEAHGIGRPSTYAPTIATLITRKYVIREQRRLFPTDTGTAVNDLLVEHFPGVVDLSFTAELEQKFDDIADGVRPWVPVVADFYGPFHEQLQQKEKEVSRKDFTEEKTDEVCPKSGHPLVIKLGRYGKFLACTGYPECRYTAPLPGSAEAQAQAAEAPTGEVCPECHTGTLVQRRSRFGSFMGCSRYPDCKYIKKQQDRTGVQCPECKAGELVGKRGARGKTFYSCDRYPDCKCAIWARPLGEACPTCGWPLVMGAKDSIRCSKKGCGYKRVAPAEKS